MREREGYPSEEAIQDMQPIWYRSSKSREFLRRDSQVPNHRVLTPRKWPLFDGLWKGTKEVQRRLHPIHKDDV